MTDYQLLEFLERAVDDLSITRDKSAGKRVRISFCHPRSGCPVEVEDRTVRLAIIKAILANLDATRPTGTPNLW